MRLLKDISIIDIISIIIPMCSLLLISFYHLFGTEQVEWVTFCNVSHYFLIVSLSVTILLFVKNKNIQKVQKIIIPYFCFKSIYEFLYYIDIEWFNFWNWFWSAACVAIIIFCLILAKKHGRVH